MSSPPNLTFRIPAFSLLCVVRLFYGFFIFYSLHHLFADDLFIDNEAWFGAKGRTTAYIVQIHHINHSTVGYGVPHAQSSSRVPCILSLDTLSLGANPCSQARPSYGVQRFLTSQTQYRKARWMRAVTTKSIYQGAHSLWRWQEGEKTQARKNLKRFELAKEHTAVGGRSLDRYHVYIFLLGINRILAT